MSPPNNDDNPWRARLAARLHDPLEKALILGRTLEGHERGTAEAMRQHLGLGALPAAVRAAVARADHWASAADRAAFPKRNSDGRYPAWQNVRFHEKPVIIHPLTGDEFALSKLQDVDPAHAKALTQGHLERLIQRDAAGTPDLRRTALAFWRFGPEIGDTAIGELWAQLPADTRVPDHSIFDHLDLTSALAGCFAVDEAGPALLAVSLGPVQDFIATARTTSDLWAGSHLLSRMAWEAMSVVCEKFGPESILFPRLRGVPQVDLWLRETCKLDDQLFEGLDWRTRRSDANPLFAAAVPNRFTAIVPAGQASELADAITRHVRHWVLQRGREAYQLLLEAAGIEDSPDLPGYAQLAEQLSGFPEVHWATVPWTLVPTDSNGKVEAGAPRLAEAMQPYFEATPPGHLGSHAWQLLDRGLELEQGWFWKPNPGALYPALHELLERALGATKTLRAFEQVEQLGWRDSLNGEAEWLTTDRKQLDLPPGARADTLWARVSRARPAWARRGEHLSAVSSLKRLWPTLLVNELRHTLEMDVSRFVVSTHTMAIATSLAKAIQRNAEIPQPLVDAVGRAGQERQVALPRKLSRTLREHPQRRILSAIPGWLDAINDEGEEQAQHSAERLLASYLGSKPEAYYGLLLMDGDEMGAWLSAAPAMAMPHTASFHPQVRAALEHFRFDANFVAYAGEPRAPSPSRHMAISEALNNFALHLAPVVVEEQHNGRILYAGGDDLMAMLPVVNLLPAMAGLRAAYSGIDTAAAGAEDVDAGFSRQGNGFVLHRGRLRRVMGKAATASCGAVVAHHQAPLGAVMRELRAAEQRAKHTRRHADGHSRDAFSLSIVKRSGGALRLTARWGEPLRLLNRLRSFLAEPEVSRRAVYHSAAWLADVPEPRGDSDVLVARMLAYQLGRQAGRRTNREHYDLGELATSLVHEAIEHAAPGERVSWLLNFLSTAEFLARETRRPSAPATTQETAA